MIFHSQLYIDIWSLLIIRDVLPSPMAAVMILWLKCLKYFTQKNYSFSLLDENNCSEHIKYCDFTMNYHDRQEV